MPHLLSETLVWCVTLLLFGMGLIGTLIPMLPGIIIIAAGCVWQGAMGRENLAWWEWTVLALLVAGGMVIDKLSGGMGAKKFGSTAAGIWGAIIGAVAPQPPAPLAYHATAGRVVDWNYHGVTHILPPEELIPSP